ncbi:MAG: PBS lyase HEAT domain protein repeat-containing protein [Methanothrix harundinacea]|uniref:PBS lyase HEAT domain protein repeat-containing protein n=1 Tax=Methanothrix harundinacea TaxID=301375 RepID=A0A101FSZ9_9EURY|nr:MAG: PBS lyase HEAT domain protein repeat-containing protein [Methanothrix harundinacea]KUK95994.1 MAG: PBS lyase HEAT domain protein repeat-containing protein [Methanothrix harundinacea]
MKQKIARELSRQGWLTLDHKPADIKREQIGFTAKEIAALISKPDADEAALAQIRRHLSDMKKYVEHVPRENNTESSESPRYGKGRAGRPPIRYVLNDAFWTGFHTREPESSVRGGIGIVDPNEEQHRLDDERVSAGEVLAKKGDQRGVDQLLQLLSDNSERARGKAALALGRLHEPRAYGPLSSMLNEDGEGIRTYAAKALGDLGDLRAIALLKKALNDSDLSVRREAKKALDKLSNL